MTTLSYHDEDHLRSVLQLQACRDVSAVLVTVAPGQLALLHPAPLRPVRGGRGSWGRGSARHGTAHSLGLVRAELLDVVPVQAGGAEALDRSEVDTLVVPPAGAGVGKAPI